MLIRRINLALAGGLATLAVLLTSCATQPTYSYYRVPCTVPGSQHATKIPNPSASSPSPSAGKQSNKSASSGMRLKGASSGSSSLPAGSKKDGCIVAVHRRHHWYGYYPGQYYPYTYYPYSYYYPYPYYFSYPYWDNDEIFEGHEDSGPFDYDQDRFHEPYGADHNGDDFDDGGLSR